MEQKILRIKELIQKLNQWAYEYYTLDNITVSDKVYDKHYDELVRLEKETNTILPYSPTQRVGDVILSKFEKVQHKNKLWSLDKVNTKEDLKEFINNMTIFCRQNNLPKPQFVVAKKYDGLTIKSEYENGGIETSATRGTGEIGENITLQSKTVIGLPHQIDFKNTIHVHGEAIMTKKAFNEYNKTAEVPLKNLRNGSAGALRNLNIKESAKRKLSVIFYNINHIEGKQFTTYTEQLEFLKEQGFPTTEYVVCNTFEEVSKAIDDIEIARPNLEYDIDGAVVSINDLKTRELLGYTIKFPKFSMAYKYEAEEDTTKLLDVEFNTGRTGKVTPRGIIEPVELAGVTVKYVTLNSMDDIKRKNIKKGGLINIRRANDVIPEALSNADDEGIEILPPTHCKTCGAELIQDGVHYFCPNTLGCKSQVVKSITHFCEREKMNIEGLSEKTVEAFIENGIIENVLDLYSLEEKKEQILKLPKFGLKKYSNLIESIENSRKTKLQNFIFALGIEGIGKSTSRDLVNHFKVTDSMCPELDTLDVIMSSKYEDFLKVKDVGETTANSLVSVFRDDKFIKLVNGLLLFIELIEEEKKEVIVDSSNPLSGKTVYPTGKFSLKKDELKQKLESVGAIISNGYSKKLDYLICGGDISKSGKADKAKEDNVPLMSEEEMMKYLK